MDGSILIDKPAGITSHDVVNRVRRMANTRRVGHAGTLDPFATGLLVVCIGRATRLVRYLIGQDKEYLATVRLGYATDTHDLTGKQITPFKTSKELDAEALRRVLEGFIGDQMQTPPMYSAKRVAGRRLYHAAREGREVEREPAPVSIYSIEIVDAGGVLTPIEGGLIEFTVRVRCSSGTYVRVLAHDIGIRLGVGAHLSALRRTAVGKLHTDVMNLDSKGRVVTLEQAERLAEQDLFSSALLSMSETVSHLPEVVLDQEAGERIAHGREVALPPLALGSLEDQSPVRLCGQTGSLIAVGVRDLARRTVRPEVVLQPQGV